MDGGVERGTVQIGHARHAGGVMYWVMWWVMCCAMLRIRCVPRHSGLEEALLPWKRGGTVRPARGINGGMELV